MSETGHHFQLPNGATLHLWQGDITELSVDAIVNAANPQMLGGGGVDGAIHRAAGPALREACLAHPEVAKGVRCPTGEARLTIGARLSASYVIHTVGPVYRDAVQSAPLLASAYRAVLRVARAHGLRSIAFPAISCGVYGYPLDEAARIAVRVCEEESAGFEAITFALFGAPAHAAWRSAARRVLPPRS